MANKVHFHRANLLGDLRAEADSAMLDRAFLETADYKTLIETSDRILVVGRRGTGKSALTLWIERYWSKARSTSVVKLTPEDYQVIGVRPLIQLFGEKFLRIRAGTKLVWRYALMMETMRCLSQQSNIRDAKDYSFLNAHLEKWNRRGASIFERFRQLMREVVKDVASPEERIGNLPIILDLTKVEDALAEVCSESNQFVVFLIDRLDEGYEPDETGVGLICGLVQAAIDLKTRLPRIRPVVFLRDNIYRAVEGMDPDYSRNIEGHVLRLHWDETALLDFAAKRLKIAFSIEEDSSQRIWNHCTSGELQGLRGFARSLQLTLYRPRDLLALLNEALYTAGKSHQAQLELRHLESTAKEISQHRLDDLQKEYEAILPSLRVYISVFQGGSPELDVAELTATIEALLVEGSQNPAIQQDFLILEDAKAVIRGLYSIGFLGVRDSISGKYVFCHDGRAPNREFAVGDKVLVHPCYWMALNCTKNQLDAEQAEDIYDEYDIEVSSETPSIRDLKINQLILQLDTIPEGSDGDGAFEAWCRKAVRICFAKGLRNVELKPNKLARQRRDVVATNLASEGVWRRIYEDYSTRQVIFEVKNYKGIAAADYQQVQSYLTGEYGKLGFIVTRDETVDLYSNRDVEWVRELYMTHQVLVIKLTGKYFTKLLYKLRFPRRLDDVNDALHKLLDTYTRLYLAGQTKAAAIEEKRRKKKAERALKRLEAAEPGRTGTRH
jgi:hypothetical protein